MAAVRDCSPGVGGKRRVVVDTDAGIDDAHALLMILGAQLRGDLELCAILTTHGNTSLENVNRNVRYLLRLVNKQNIPVYQGCRTSLLGIPVNSPNYHGHDGFGDVLEREEEESLPTMQLEHAASALVQLVNKYPGSIELVCLGPLTNLATAIKLDPDLGLKLHSCVVMGGNYLERGNTDVDAEFNFAADPEAVCSVLNQLNSCLTLITWDLSLTCLFSLEWYKKFIGVDNEVCRFLKKIEEKTIKESYIDLDRNFYITCDQIAAAVAIDRSLIKHSNRVHCTVELHNRTTRGKLMLEQQGTETDVKPNVEIVTEIDKERYEALLMSIMHHDYEKFKVN